jgi:hypothetical protein
LLITNIFESGSINVKNKQCNIKNIITTSKFSKKKFASKKKESEKDKEINNINNFL